jgi:hypothetical protein
MYEVLGSIPSIRKKKTPLYNKKVKIHRNPEKKAV